MQGIAVIIPAQEKNPYRRLGDLAPFGDTTLIEWKISQCKEFAGNESIYITTASEKIINIAKKEGINFILRSYELEYDEVLSFTVQKIKEDIIVWAIPTAPFISGKLYKKMIDRFVSLKSFDSLVSVKKMNEYLFFQNNKMNFSDSFISRREIEPAYMVTNGCYVIHKDLILKNRSLFGQKEYLYEIDTLASVEIKDIEDISFANNLIFHYFKQEVLD